MFVRIVKRLMNSSKVLVKVGWMNFYVLCMLCVGTLMDYILTLGYKWVEYMCNFG